MTRKIWIGGNWKCNGSKHFIQEICSTINKVEFDKNKTSVNIFPTSLHLGLVRESLKPEVFVGSQNLSKTGNGAYTGEISVDILKDFGISNSLIGHSERRQLYGEGDDVIAEKVKITQDKDFSSVICIGEVLKEREEGKTNEVCKRQLKAVIPHIKNWGKVVIAYEPVWAIGTGKVATPEQAQDAHKFIRSFIETEVGKKEADEILIVYGGSVNEKNCCDLIKQADIDGFLIGGASLKPEFAQIIKCSKKC